VLEITNKSGRITAPEPV